ncbi:hypothetical protein B9G55_02345 [Saccharibacillus sp. O16]|nr:hypothetical protein B9G55_02345 [Saccharibacillus sp. O16]
MKILFPASPLNDRQPDESYAEEYEAARQSGFAVGLIHLEELLLNQDADRAVRRLPVEENPVECLYRGWMLKPYEYEQLDNALRKRHLHLMNSPESYRHVHYLPESYRHISAYTPASVWLPIREITSSFEEVYEAIRPFGEQPIIVKDYVKSRKHEWLDACYIPNAADREQVKRVVQNFLDRQGEELNEGLVFRQFVELEFLEHHERSGMPLSREIRVFVWEGRPMYVSTYWSAGRDEEFDEVLGQFAQVMASIQSRFFTMDFAKAKNGPWIVLELGDGQTAGLPDDADAVEFYGNLYRAVGGEG